MDPDQGPSPPRRPMAVARRISLFRREVIERVSPAAIEVLFTASARISEGQVARDGRYYGSTMLTIDLESLRDHVADRCEATTAARLSKAMEEERSIHEAAARLALEEARRIAGRRLRRVEADVRVRTEGTKVFIDVDVEADASVMPALEEGS